MLMICSSPYENEKPSNGVFFKTVCAYIFMYKYPGGQKWHQMPWSCRFSLRTQCSEPDPGCLREQYTVSAAQQWSLRSNL